MMLGSAYIISSASVSYVQAASNAMLTVTVTDCNDHPPLLSQSSYAFTLDERTTGPSSDEVVFSDISVTDNDASASNRAMVFDVVGEVATVTNNWFDINSATVSRSCSQHISILPCVINDQVSAVFIILNQPAYDCLYIECIYS